MTRIIVDEVLLNKLRNLSEPLELCDKSGRLLARIEPVAAVDLSQYEPWEPPISEDELRRREQSKKWYTTEQVLERLKNLENQ